MLRGVVGRVITLLVCNYYKLCGAVPRAVGIWSRGTDVVANLPAITVEQGSAYVAKRFFSVFIRRHDIQEYEMILEY